VNFTIGYFNWDISLGNLQINPMSKSTSFLDLLLDDKTAQTQCSTKERTKYYSTITYYDGLSDSDKYAKITFKMFPSPTRAGNNFGISKFIFYVAPCFKTCLTCSSPAADHCQTCVDPNASLVNGQCKCNSGFDRDPYDSNYPCARIL
jgi:hypothetical protein